VVTIYASVAKLWWSLTGPDSGVCEIIRVGSTKQKEQPGTQPAAPEL